MLDMEQKYKDLFNTYGGKSIRLVFFKDEYRALYPSETLFPSEQLYPSEMSADSVAFEITNEMVHTDTMTITESLCSDENLDFGACECARMEIIVSGLDQDIAGKEFLLIESFADYELIRGIFTVDSTPRENDRDTRRIIAYDRMKRFDEDVAGWYKTLQFPMTLKEFRASLCDFVGVPQSANINLVNDNMTVEKTIEPDTLFGRDVIRSICQINGVFGNINQMGEIRYVSVTKKESITDTISIYKTVESEEYTVPDVDTVWIRKEEGDIGGASDGGDGMNVVIVEGNFLVYGKTTSQQSEVANNILSVISGLEYRPAEIIGNGAPWYEMGDRIAVETSDGTVNTIIMSRTSTGIQGVMDEIVSTGSKELKQTFSIRTQVLETKGMSAVLKRTVEEVSNHLTNFEENTESKFIQTASQIQAEVTRATKAEETLTGKITVEAGRITSEVTRATKAEGDLGTRITQTATEIRSEVSNTAKGLQSQITQNASNISLKVSKGDVSSQISVETGGVNIKGNRFTWNATNSSMTADGKLTCSNAVISGNITAGSGKIGGFSISGNNLVSSSSSTVIRWGDFYVDGKSATIGSLTMDNNGLEIGYIGPDNYGHWESDTGDIYVNEVYPTDEDGWWKGWGVLQTVRELWDYVHGGGWSPCPSDGGCDGGGCDSGCDSCGGDCNSYELPCDILGCGSDGGCSCDSNSCDGCSYSCDNLEGPGC